MECECIIDIDHDAGPEFANNYIRIARKYHACCECETIIKPGDRYEEYSGKWESGFQIYKTCFDCLSVKDALFCSYYFTMIWEDLAEKIHENSKLPAAECMMMLTKPARDRVCDMIEEQWGEEDEV